MVWDYNIFVEFKQIPLLLLIRLHPCHYTEVLSLVPRTCLHFALREYENLLATRQSTLPTYFELPSVSHICFLIVGAKGPSARIF